MPSLLGSALVPKGSENQQEGTEMTSEKAKMIEVTARIMKVLSDAYAEKVMLYASSLQTIQEEREDAEGGKHHDTGERSRQ